MELKAFAANKFVTGSVVCQGPQDLYLSVSRD